MRVFLVFSACAIAGIALVVLTLETTSQPSVVLAGLSGVLIGERVFRARRR
jgi:xanthosine utilization system XapX-like protein